MKDRTLIIRGVETTDELSSLGMSVAEKYSECNRVVLINKRGQSRVVKGSERDASLTDLIFIDADDGLSDVQLCLNKIKAAYEHAHPETKDLAHSFVGQWLYYYIPAHSLGISLRAIILLGNGQLEMLRKSADDFIERDFGMSSTAILLADGSQIPWKLDPPAGAIPGNDGAGDDLRADS